MRLAKVIVPCLLVAASAVASAQTAAPPATATPQPLPANRWTPAQIREAFERADADANGQLSRAEAQRLAIMPRSFEDTDANKDGALVLAEYESSFQP